MAFSEFEQKKIELEMEPFMAKRRPPEEMRHEVDLGWRIEGQSVLIFSIRPRWEDLREKTEGMIAKATFNRTRNVWKVLWMPADLKWHGYEPMPEARDFSQFLSLVHQDEYCCFWG